MKSNLMDMWAVAEAWLETLIVQQPVAQLTESHPAPIRGSANRESPEPLPAHLILQIFWTKLQELIRLEALTEGSSSEPARTPKKPAARPARRK